jgi:drug/metabolite transporter (DMT)-like permease
MTFPSLLLSPVRASRAAGSWDCEKSDILSRHRTTAIRVTPLLWHRRIGGLVLLPIVYLIVPAMTGASPPSPTLAQWLVLFLFGALQMGFPYFLVAKGLRTVSPQEAGTITLLEPLLNPVWAFWLAGEVPSPWTLAGGAFILGALVWRYWPRRPFKQPRNEGLEGVAPDCLPPG